MPKGVYERRGPLKRRRRVPPPPMDEETPVSEQIAEALEVAEKHKSLADVYNAVNGYLDSISGKPLEDRRIDLMALFNTLDSIRENVEEAIIKSMTAPTSSEE